jgi:hypothetical protein
MSQPVHIRPTPFDTDELTSGPITLPAGQETTLISLTIRNGWHAYLTSLAYYLASSTTLVEFRCYLGGVLMTGPASFVRRKTQLGQIGNPLRLPNPRELQPGMKFEIRAYNGDASSITGECDGDIEYHEKPL